MKPVNNLLGQRFGRLLVLERTERPGKWKNDTAAWWNCQCDCGKIVPVRGYSMTGGKQQKSCGCLKLEAPHLVKFSGPKYTPEEAAARTVWNRKSRGYNKMPFDDFFQMSKLPCFYCGDLPSLVKYASRADAVPFIRNTLDRIDSSLEHTIDNVVPACMICNCGKLNRTMDQFMEHIARLCSNLNRISPENCRQLSTTISAAHIFEPQNYPLLRSIEVAKDFYDIDHPGKITLTMEQFYQMASSNCYYCGLAPSNKYEAYCKKATGFMNKTVPFIYSGLDRVDSNFGHDYDNVVPSCKWCNFAKRSLPLHEFDAWIRRLIAKSTQQTISIAC